jgi:CDP-diacylglycerol--glycerol-3-phosphate 3-phosphatidyltransferase
MSVVSGSFRSRFRATIEQPVARVFARTGLSPNALTLIGVAIAVFGAVLAAQQAWLLAGLVVAFGAVFDLFDGALARATGKTSKFGAFLDSTMDRAGEAVVYIGLVIAFMRLLDVNGTALSAAAMAAAFMVSYTRAKSESLGFSSGTGMANIGLAPREIRSAILVAGLLLASADYRLLVGALAVIAVLATITAIQRVYFVYRQSQSTS